MSGVYGRTQSSDVTPCRLIDLICGRTAPDLTSSALSDGVACFAVLSAVIASGETSRSVTSRLSRGAAIRRTWSTPGATRAVTVFASVSVGSAAASVERVWASVDGVVCSVDASWPERAASAPNVVAASVTSGWRPGSARFTASTTCAPERTSVFNADSLLSRSPSTALVWVSAAGAASIARARLGLAVLSVMPALSRNAFMFERTGPVNVPSRLSNSTGVEKSAAGNTPSVAIGGFDAGPRVIRM
jgi:hypothetical protein